MWKNALGACAIAALAGLAHADNQGVGDFDWFIFDTAEGQAFVDPALNMIQIIGGNAGIGGQTGAMAFFPQGGTVSFTASYFSEDVGNFDFAEYVINGEPFLIADNDNQGFQDISFDVPPGREVGFVVTTVDGQFGPGQLQIENFRFTPINVEPTCKAIVIANWDYPENCEKDDGGDYSPADLPGTLIDAANMTSLLESAGYSVVRLENTTAGQISAAIHECLPDQDDEKLVVYYAGHGDNHITLKNSPGDGSLVNVDCTVVTPEVFASRMGEVGNQITTILDSCGSGGFAQAVEGMTEPDPGFLTATSDRFQCAGKDHDGGGVFTNMLLNAVNDAANDTNGDGMVDLEEAGAVVATCPGDFNMDGVLNILDFVDFQGAFQDGDPSADCNGDGVFNILDFVCFQELFQQSCEQTPYYNGEGVNVKFTDLIATETGPHEVKNDTGEAKKSVKVTFAGTGGTLTRARIISVPEGCLVESIKAEMNMVTITFKEACVPDCGKIKFKVSSEHTPIEMVGAEWE